MRSLAHGKRRAFNLNWRFVALKLSFGGHIEVSQAEGLCGHFIEESYDGQRHGLCDITVY